MQYRTAALAATLALFLTAVTVTVADVPRVRIFSTDTTQTIFNGGLLTLHHGNVYETPLDLLAPVQPVEEFVPNFLPGQIGLDALQAFPGDDTQPPGFVFSTDRTAQIDNGGELFQLFHGAAYYYNTLTELVSVYGPLEGLELDSLDGLAAMPDDVIDGATPAARKLDDPFPGEPVAWAFSTGQLEHIIQDGDIFTLHPGNIYCYNRLTDLIIVLAETETFGIDQVDALDAGEAIATRSLDPGPTFLAPIAFSPGRTQLVRINGRLVRLLSNSMYLILPEVRSRGISPVIVEQVFDGNSVRIRDLDAYSTPNQRRQGVPGACVTSSSCFQTEAFSCDGFFFPFESCEQIGCICEDFSFGCDGCELLKGGGYEQCSNGGDDLGICQ